MPTWQNAPVTTPAFPDQRPTYGDPNVAHADTTGLVRDTDPVPNGLDVSLPQGDA